MRESECRSGSLGEQRSIWFVFSRQIPADASGDLRRGVLDRVPCQVCVPGSRLDLRVTEQLPDHREALAQGQRLGLIPVPQVIRQQEDRRV